MEVWGLAIGGQDGLVHGTTTVTPVLDGTVPVTVTLTLGELGRPGANPVRSHARTMA